ncbi:MAG: HNH endonuclease, partial [Selenomonadaceae bacterium]|nr:HNH endonuclease [Selenomonadaceae bacterium]
MKVKVIEHARYGKCRVGEEGWIVGRDVARILGYANADGFVRKHVAAQNKRLDSVRALDSLHCARTALINQAGLDELLAATDNPDAAEIKAWLLSESARLDAVHSEESNSLPQVLVPQVFNHPQFGNLRAVNIGGEPFFIGSDVAKALGYRNTRQAIIDHVPDKFKKDGVAIRDSVGGTNSPILINEAGLYKLIMRSRLPETEKFSDWACGEVLPSIRKDGCYVASEQNNNLLRRKEYERRCYEEAKLAYDAFIPYYPLTLENLDGEEWKEIEGFDGVYQISNFGRTKRFHKYTPPRILKPYLNRDYLRIGLYLDNKRVKRFVHILVAQAFISNPDNKPEVNHEDGHKFNCHVSNLYWSTSTE